MAEHGEYRSIYTTLADDEEFIATSPLAKAVFYTLKLKLPSTGIGSVPVHVVAALVNATREDVDAAFNELSPKWVQREKSLCWIVNGLRFHPNLSEKDWKHRKSVVTQLDNLPRTILTGAFRKHYQSWVDAPTQPHHSGSTDSSKALPSANEAPSKGVGSTNTKTTNNHEDRTTAVECLAEGEQSSTLEGPSPSAYSLALVIAANQGMAANPEIGEQLNPITNNPGKSFQASEEIREAGVALEFAKSTVFDLAKAFMPSGRSKQISSLGYFGGAVIGRWEEFNAMQAASAAPKPAEMSSRSRRGTSNPRGEGMILFGKLREAISSVYVQNDPNDPGSGGYQARRIAPEVLAALPQAALTALRTIGGERAITAAHDDQMPILAGQFATAYAGVAQ